jgi:hypothetical protein
MRLPVLLVLFVAACVPGPLVAQDTPLGGNRYRPDLDFRTLTVGRIDIHFHQGLEALAQRLAGIVRTEAPALERRFASSSGRVRIVLVDQTDVSNGWATVVPYNLIEIAAAPPPGRSLIGNTDDWLRLVFIHEYTHVLHLEKSGGWFGSLRKVFGRVPLFYPNLFVPDWQIEGLATYQESASTQAGRIPAGDFRSMLLSAAREEKFPELDQATGAVIDWPGGSSAYLFGGYFHQFLADRYGTERLMQLGGETASRLPFTEALAFREVYGKSLGTLWREFREQVTADAAKAPGATLRSRLTHHGFTAASPVFAADGRLFYATATPHDFPAVTELLADGSGRRVANRYHGSRVAVSGDRVVFDALELSDNVALVSDLYAAPIAGGGATRLTHGARAADPDVSPDGRMIVCTVQRTGSRILATLPIGSASGDAVPAPLIEETDTEFSAPRWSPDGTMIAAERRRLNGPSEIVVIDAATRAIRTLVSTAAGRNILPTWLPDGRTVLFSSDHGREEFTLYAVSIADGSIRRVDGAGPGAQGAVLSPAGDRLVFVGYSSTGFDLYALPFEAAALAGAAPVAFTDDRSSTQPPAAAEDAPLPSRAYSPSATLLPRFWIPYLETDGDDTVFGAGTAGFDALGRHSYTVTAGWAVPRQSADVQVDYTYSRWWPSLFVSLSDEADAWREGHIRTRELTGGVLLPWRKVRWNTSVLAAASVSTDRFEPASDLFPERADRRRDALRLGWTLSTARAYGYSISAEEGSSLNVVTEFASGGPSGDRGSAASIAGSARAYVRAWPRHGVVAMRVAGATSRGDVQARRVFSVGGSGPRGGGFGIGVDAIGLLRGFDEGDLSGWSAAVVNTDYRVPLGWPQRGLGTLPVFLRAVHGAVFFDLGQTWDDRRPGSAWRRSVGGELSLDLVLASFAPVTLAGGVAWRHDPRGGAEGAAFFARIGRAF